MAKTRTQGDRATSPESLPMMHPYEPGQLPRIKSPKVLEHVTSTGLTVVALRYPSVPRFQMILKLPGGTSWDARHGNRARIASGALMTGTRSISEAELARRLQSIGATLTVGLGVDHITLRGGGLSTNLREFIDLLSEVLTDAAFARSEIEVVKKHTAQSLSIRKSDPDAIARDRLSRELYGKHPYGRGTPDPTTLNRIRASEVGEYFRQHARPSHALLVIVGNISPRRTTDLIEQRLNKWQGILDKPHPPEANISEKHRVVLMNRPGAVQTNIRLGGPALSRSSEGYFDLLLANTVFGGYFSSRLVEKVREERGYSYSPRSAIEHHDGASTLTISADVATEVSAAALVEIEYELLRMATAPITQSELDAARTYVAGVTSLSIQTQGGMASTLATLYSAGLKASYLGTLQRNLSEVTLDSVREVAAKFLIPTRMSTVLLGDARLVGDAVSLVEPAVELENAETRPHGR